MMFTTPLISDVYVNIKAVERARDAIRYAMLMNYPARIIGAPGLGKSTALYHLANEFDGAYIEIGAQQKGIGGLYRGILHAIGGAQYGSFDREILDSVLTQFKRRARYTGDRKDLLIVDEFQTLEDTAKRELLRIHETSGFALVLSGNHERLEASGKKPTGAIRQVEDRIGLTIELPALDHDDCDLIANAYGVQDADALEAARALGTKANARELGRVLQFAKEISGGNAMIRLVHIKNAVVALKGKTTAIDLLKS